MCKAGDDELALRGCKVVEEDVVVDVSLFEELSELSERARLLGEGLGIDSLFCCIDSSVDAIQQEIVGSNVVRCKFSGTCDGGQKNV